MAYTNSTIGDLFALLIVRMRRPQLPYIGVANHILKVDRACKFICKL